ncbi:TIGR03086 family metal-binding protein [Stackebrandtia soli]|uniref:TIGR03086 family metal-binding protein n=1 Tax=Stackebrandtia soli TaxID=1892856 RepID=UPI0039E9CE44
MLKLSDMYEQAATLTVPIVAAVRDDQLADPTPCTEFTVRDLLGHLFAVVTEFEKSARGEPMDFGGTHDWLTGEWRTDFATRVDALRHAWMAEDAMSHPSTMLPREVAAQLPPFDLTIHGWDLARALDVPLVVPAELTEAVAALSETLAPMRGGSGMFAEAVPVPADASDFDRLLGSLGRDPEWSRTAR